jgi:hypothetical protein
VVTPIRVHVIRSSSTNSWITRETPGPPPPPSKQDFEAIPGRRRAPLRECVVRQL